MTTIPERIREEARDWAERLDCNQERATGMAGEMLARDGILDAEFECENAHFGSALAQSGPIKSASLDCRPVARSHFVPSLNANGKARVT